MNKRNLETCNFKNKRILNTLVDKRDLITKICLTTRNREALNFHFTVL